MKSGKDIFIKDDELPWQTVDKGVRRKIMAHDQQLMLVKVAFDAGSIGSIHEHFHSQMTFIESGKFEVTIGEEKKLLTKGDVFYIPPHVLHGVLCLEAGVLVDAFSPARADFL